MKHIKLFENFMKNTNGAIANSNNNISREFSKIEISAPALQIKPPPFNNKTQGGTAIGPVSTPPPIPKEFLNKTSPPPIPKPVEYFIVFQGTQKGPLDIKTVKEMLALNMIENNTLIWTEGMNEWKRINEIEL